ncbi:MAG: hypothetical protein COB02_00490 [Candidatus Cloacimonadota bacterium]|nr:MAG: hypothetical protein COB02_00490 [Candidatus Cloacimonadota bacterium]
MENSNKSTPIQSDFESFKTKSEFNLLELENILNINHQTIRKYCLEFKKFLPVHSNYNQKDIQTLVLIQSMTKSGLPTNEIESKLFEYQQLMKKTMNGTHESPVRFLKNLPEACGLTSII